MRRDAPVAHRCGRAAHGSGSRQPQLLRHGHLPDERRPTRSIGDGDGEYQNETHHSIDVRVGRAADTVRRRPDRRDAGVGQRSDLRRSRRRGDADHSAGLSGLWLAGAGWSRHHSCMESGQLLSSPARLPTARPDDAAGPPRAMSRGITVLLQIALVAVVLAVLPFKLFELDRYFVPKELVLHVAALGAAIFLLPRGRSLTLDAADLLLAFFLMWSIVSGLFATNY